MSVLCRKEKIWFMDTLVTIHVAAKSNADGMSVIEHRMPHGSSPPLHIHHTEDEIFQVLAGQARFTVGGRQIEVRAGDTLVAPKGLPHTFIVTSQEDAIWLTVTNNGDFERMLRSVGRPAEHDGLPPRVEKPSPAQVAALDLACRSHGIELTGPPLTIEAAAQSAAA
jgi:quercetin dioxygenase-like cupin family protein